MRPGEPGYALAAVAADKPQPKLDVSRRVATIDWMRGLVMVLMVIDHASMAFDGHHLAHDSASYPDAMTMALPGAEFFTRWITHLCAPTFVFLAGTALAMSIERRVVKGVDAWSIDKNILMRGAVIALLDPTLISFGSGWWTFSVLTAIGLSMMCMAALRRLPTWGLLAVGLGWIAFGEIVTGWFWHPPANPSIPAAFLFAPYSAEGLSIKYALFPWLAVMVLGWVFGRHLIRYAAGLSTVSGKKVLWFSGTAALAIFVDRARHQRVRQHVPVPGGQQLAAVAACEQIPAVADVPGARNRHPAVCAARCFARSS